MEFVGFLFCISGRYLGQVMKSLLSDINMPVYIKHPLKTTSFQSFEKKKLFTSVVQSTRFWDINLLHNVTKISQISCGFASIHWPWSSSNKTIPNIYTNSFSPYQNIFSIYNVPLLHFIVIPSQRQNDTSQVWRIYSYIVITLSVCLSVKSTPVRARGLSRECAPLYPQRDRKRRLNGAVCRNHRIKRLVPCRC